MDRRIVRREYVFQFLQFANDLVPATTLTFGEEFRPVRLEKYCYGFPQTDQENDFQFDSKLNNV